MRLIYAIIVAIQAWKMARKGKPSYVAITKRGVPFVACFMAFDREAWRISQRAIEEFKSN